MTLKSLLLSYLSCWFRRASAVWWSSQIDGRVKTLEEQSLNIAKENRRYIEQVVQPSYGIGKNWKNQYHDEWVLKGGWK